MLTENIKKRLEDKLYSVLKESLTESDFFGGDFMQYEKKSDGTVLELPKKNVDTGAGLERFASIMQNKLDNYDTDLFVNLKTAVSDLTGVKETAENKSSFKGVCRHL